MCIRDSFNNRIQATIDNVNAASVSFNGNPTHNHDCLKSNLSYNKVSNFWRFINHSNDTVQLSLSTTAETNEDTGWAVNTVRLQLCLCPKGCATCNGPASCLACVKENQIIDATGKCVEKPSGEGTDDGDTSDEKKNEKKDEVKKEVKKEEKTEEKKEDKKEKKEDREDKEKIQYIGMMYIYIPLHVQAKPA
eukprot:TRINITY_DN5190_c0_g1_i2.p1 TRINITY_DN5190_c0_g1~~TRINITY_DN5190_c0_g1_i2.p1  ORF type:complete len:214 (+),score=82.56 TRINITY_DN5190_c0_g1_i2:67-642(+)